MSRQNTTAWRETHALTTEKSGKDGVQDVSSAEQQLASHAQEQNDPGLHVQREKYQAHSSAPVEMETYNILGGRGASGGPVEPVPHDDSLREAQHAAPHTSQQVPLVAPSRPASAPPRPRPSPSPPAPTAAAAAFPGVMAAGTPRPDRSGTLMNHLRSFGEYIALPLRRHATPPPPSSGTPPPPSSGTPREPSSGTPREPSRSLSGARSGSEASKAAAGAAAAGAGAGGGSRLWGTGGGVMGNGGGGEGSLGRSGGGAPEPSTAGNVSGSTGMAPSMGPAGGDRATAAEPSTGGPGFPAGGQGGTPRSDSAGTGLQLHAQHHLGEPRARRPASLPAVQQQQQQQHLTLPRAPPPPEAVKGSAAAGGSRPMPQSRVASSGHPAEPVAAPVGVAGDSRRQDQALHAADRAAALAAAQVLSGTRVEQHHAYQLLAALVRRWQKQQQGGLGATRSAGQSAAGAPGSAAQRSAAMGAFLRALGCDAGVGQ